MIEGVVVPSMKIASPLRWKIFSRKSSESNLREVIQEVWERNLISFWSFLLKAVEKKQSEYNLIYRIQ